MDIDKYGFFLVYQCENAKYISMKYLGMYWLAC